MSAQEVRQQIIREQIPLLIKHLTGLKEDDGDFQRLEALSSPIVKNHRYLSTNSHEVRRKIENFKEKFRVDNYAEYGELLQKCCDEIINDPICSEHYETDLHWSIIDFLLTMSYNPVGALRRNQNKIILKEPVVEPIDDSKNEQVEKEYWSKMLKENFIPITEYGSNSDLSEWSDRESSGEMDQNEGVDDKKIKSKTDVRLLDTLPCLKPPEKEKPYKDYDATTARENLLRNVQHSWWLSGMKYYQTIVDSDRMEANFALIYSRFICENSNRMICRLEPSTMPELLLLREIILMFHGPAKCKFFKYDSNVVSVRPNVTIPSVSVDCLQQYLKINILPYLDMMHTLQNFITIVYDCESFTSSNTLECYAANLRIFLRPIWNKLIEYEYHIIEQKPFRILSLIQFHAYMQESFNHLQSVYKIHMEVCPDIVNDPSHVCTAYLLTSLLHYSNTTGTTTESNLAMSLFLASFRTYCEIIDIWWSEARLDDWKREYIAEKIGAFDHNVSIRNFTDNINSTPLKTENAEKLIRNSRLFELLKKYTLRAGRSLNLLHEFYRSNDLSNACTEVKGKLYSDFIEKMLNSIEIYQKLDDDGDKTAEKNVLREDEKFKNECNDEIDGACKVENDLNKDWIEMDDEDEHSLHDDDEKFITTNDSFLCMAFKTYVEKLSSKDVVDTPLKRLLLDKKFDKCAWKIFQLLQSTTCIIPFEVLVIEHLTSIFQSRISFCDSFCVKFFNEELQIAMHLRHLRKIILMESSDLMFQFYTKLFHQIETVEGWANPSILTAQLEDLICTYLPEASSLFHVEIFSVLRCQTEKVCEAAEELHIGYSYNRELSYIISPQDIDDYNKVFRFLLKIKWGLWALENMRFSRSSKRRLPYEPFSMIDLIMRRFEQLRFWMIYALQSIHSHLMTHVLQSMGDNLEKNVLKCTNLHDIEIVHQTFVNSLCEHFFIEEEHRPIKTGIEQLLNLIYIMRMEWNLCVEYKDQNHPLAKDNSVDSSPETKRNDFVTNTQIEELEMTYVRCHQYLANKLNHEVYVKHNSFMSSLCTAFNQSVPY